MNQMAMTRHSTLSCCDLTLTACESVLTRDVRYRVSYQVYGVGRPWTAKQRPTTKSQDDGIER